VRQQPLIKGSLNGYKRSRTKLNGKQQMAFEGPIFVKIVIEIQEETICN
jgi:hypothetical protein